MLERVFISFSYTIKKNVINTVFLALHLTFTFLLGKIHVSLTTYSFLSVSKLQRGVSLVNNLWTWNTISVELGLLNI